MVGYNADSHRYLDDIVGSFGCRDSFHCFVMTHNRCPDSTADIAERRGCSTGLLLGEKTKLLVEVGQRLL